MKWHYTEAEIRPIQSVNPETGKHLLCVSANRRCGGEPVRYLKVFVEGEPDVDDVRELIIRFQEEYDESGEVNVFYVNGKRCWLESASRVKIARRMALEKGVGKERTVLWLNEIPVELGVDAAMALLDSLELYASECYDNTLKKINEIRGLETLEECLSYDITTGYPEPLRFNIFEEGGEPLR